MINNHGKPQNATAQHDERAHELAEQLNLLKAVDRRITPEHLERRFRELTRRLGDADLSVPADVNRQVLRESGIQRGGLRHRRLPKILRWLPVPLFAVDALLLLSFFSGVTDVNWAQPLSAALVFAVLLAAMATGISFAFFRFAGNRLQQDGNTGSRRTGDEPKADKHRARRARRGSRRFGPSRWTDAVALAAAAVLTIALVITGIVFGLGFSRASVPQSVAFDPHTAVPAVSVVIVATATANEPAPTLSADTLRILRSAADSSAGAAAAVVSPSDGQATVLPLTPRSSNALLRAEVLQANAVAVERALDNETAAGQLDLLTTITAATRSASRPGTLIVVSSGLSTAGGFNLMQVGWGADPGSVAAQLKASGLLPDLAGWRVVFVGLGVVAGRQPALPQPQQVTLAAYWTAICQASGAASCSVDHSARPQLASHVTGQVPVVPVPVVASVRGPGSASTTTLPDTLLFPFNSSTLVPSADTILQPVAQKARSQHLLVSITGYTSPDGGSNAYNLALSAKRADAVRDRLVALGLPAKQIIQVIGAGTGGKSPDACVVNGHLDEAICAQLRRVVVVLSPANANP